MLGVVRAVRYQATTAIAVAFLLRVVEVLRLDLAGASVGAICVSEGEASAKAEATPTPMTGAATSLA